MDISDYQKREKFHKSRMLLLSISEVMEYILKNRSDLILIESLEKINHVDDAKSISNLRVLLDRSAVFWISFEELKRKKASIGWGIMNRLENSTPYIPRIYQLAINQNRVDLDKEISDLQDSDFISQISFSRDCLASGGPIYVQYPESMSKIDNFFGEGTSLSIARKRAHELEEELADCWTEVLKLELNKEKQPVKSDRF